jgi:hypothetical protein
MDSTNASPNDRTLGFWLRAVDALLDRAIAEALATEQLSRRDWMLLNVLDGRVDAPWLQERLARKGGGRIRRLADRGWVTLDDDQWTLTDEGRAARERLGELVDGVRKRVAGAVSPEDYATTIASLEAIARELGWTDDGSVAFRGRGRRGFGFGPRGGFGPGFGPRHGFGPYAHGFGPRPGFGPFGRGFGPHGHGRGCAPADDTAYERGFTAGFAQGREAGAGFPAASVAPTTPAAPTA